MEENKLKLRQAEFLWKRPVDELPPPYTLVLTSWGNFNASYYLAFWYGEDARSWKVYGSSEEWIFDKDPKYWAHIPPAPNAR